MKIVYVVYKRRKLFLVDRVTGQSHSKELIKIFKDEDEASEYTDWENDTEQYRDIDYIYEEFEVE